MKYRVLLIDDEPGALEGMQMWIDWQNFGFEICGTSTNGSEGLRMIEALSPDLVITDVNMPIMNGLEMITTWQQQNSTKKVKFAILSGYSDFEYAQKALRYGINHYFVKPMIVDEAAKELKEIYQELANETEAQRLQQMANDEEITTFIKGLLNGKLEEDRDLQLLTTLSTRRKAWNFCLIHTEPLELAEIREEVASLLALEECLFLIDLAPNSFGIVYGYSQTDDGIRHVLTKLQARYSNHRLFMAIGADEPSLLKIRNCYRTAKETVVYKFYDHDYTTIISYQDIRNTPFHYNYEQMRFLDDMTHSINTLDILNLQQAVIKASCHFREMLVAPEIVKKVVIHMMYTMIEYMRETSEVPLEVLLRKYRIPEISVSVITLNDLMSNLFTCGGDSIHILMKDQIKKSQGIIQEINNYIHEHYFESLTIKRLSEVFFIHPVYLGQLLIKKNGMTFNEMLHNLRIEEAIRLLRENKLRNNEIAEKVGYINYDHFFKQFKKRMHMSASEYKNINT